jgi:hypothetical protein
LGNDGSGHLEITDPPGRNHDRGGRHDARLPTANAPSPAISHANAGNVALFGSYMASMFAAAEGSVAATSVEAAQSEALIVHPHTG